MKSILLTIAMFALFIPFIFEILLFNGILKDHGSTIESRRPLYTVLVFVGLAGIIRFLTNRDRIDCSK